MKLKKLLKRISEGTYVSIIINRDYICTCEASDVDDKLLDCNVKFITASSFARSPYSERNYVMTPKINIYCE